LRPESKIQMPGRDVRGVGEMSDEYKPHGESKTARETIYENILVIMVLIISFIYFLFQLYAWFSSSQM